MPESTWEIEFPIEPLVMVASNAKELVSNLLWPNFSCMNMCLRSLSLWPSQYVLHSDILLLLFKIWQWTK
jgi:hypothetical protein